MSTRATEKGEFVAIFPCNKCANMKGAKRGKRGKKREKKGKERREKRGGNCFPQSHFYVSLSLSFAVNRTLNGDGYANEIYQKCGMMN